MGIYAYRKSILQKITSLNASPLEKAEKLEQLRWLENGFKIKTAITNQANTGVDTPQDLEKLQKNMPI
jgi:3-deoxy-manno-octulosonate cytidylyltransferase (CMP-KDO synthetase)